MMIQEAQRLIAAIGAFNTAQDGDSGDAENDAACAMRDAAKEFMLAASARDIELAEVIDAWQTTIEVSPVSPPVADRPIVHGGDNTRSGAMEFTTLRYADISNGYLPESDHALLLQGEAPNHLATLDKLYGAFFYLPDEEGFETFAEEACKFGFSERFIEIMRELSRQEIPFVRFDADGANVDGIEPDPEFAAM